jgi:hypothetical protein
MRRHARYLLMLVALTVTACTAPLQGPQADLVPVATPDPVPVTVRPVSPPMPAVGPGRWRAWVPRQVQPNGDVTDGHWLEISLTPPPVETLEPVKPMPRAPKTHLGAKSPAVPTPQAPVPQPATVTPVLPSGLLQQDGQSAVRLQRTPTPRLPLGGQ